MHKDNRSEGVGWLLFLSVVAVRRNTGTVHPATFGDPLPSVALSLYLSLYLLECPIPFCTGTVLRRELNTSETLMWSRNLAFARANECLFVRISFSLVSVARRRESNRFRREGTRFRRRREIIMMLVSQSTRQTESRCNRGEMQLTPRYHNPITPLPLLRAVFRDCPFEQRALIPRENLIFFRSFEFS